MTNKLILIVIMMIPVSACFAQSNQSSLNIFIGPSIPVGKYGSTNGDNRKVGYAKTGEYLKISVTHLMNKRFGISAQLQFQRNPLNTAVLESYISKTGQYPAVLIFADSVFNPNRPPRPAYSGPHRPWTSEKSSWFATNLLVGAFTEFPFSHTNLSAFIEANVGATYASTPSIHAESNTDTSAARLTQASKSAFGFAYSASTGLHYRLNGKTSITFTVDYFGTSNITFKNVKTNAYGTEMSTPLPSYWSSSRTQDMKQSISSINVGFGIAFRF